MAPHLALLSFTGEERHCKQQCQPASVGWGPQGQEEGNQDLPFLISLF